MVAASEFATTFDNGDDEQRLEAIRRMSPSERGQQVFRVTAERNRVLWAEGERLYGAENYGAVRRHFLVTLYGDEIADRVEAYERLQDEGSSTRSKEP